MSLLPGFLAHKKSGSSSKTSVAIEGYGEIATTNQMGNFEIPSHYAQGQQVTVRATKDGLTATKTGPAGDGFELSLRR